MATFDGDKEHELASGSSAAPNNGNVTPILGKKTSQSALDVLKQGELGLNEHSSEEDFELKNKEGGVIATSDKASAAQMLLTDPIGAIAEEEKLHKSDEGSSPDKKEEV